MEIRKESRLWPYIRTGGIDLGAVEPENGIQVAGMLCDWGGLEPIVVLVAWTPGDGDALALGAEVDSKPSKDSELAVFVHLSSFTSLDE